MSEHAEALYESIGGGLCVCQLAEVSHWCETCQRRIGLIDEAFRSHVDRQTKDAGATKVEGSQGESAQNSSSRPVGSLPQERDETLWQQTRLLAAIQAVIRDTRDFNEKKQEVFCRWCRYRGAKLHHPDCCIYELHGAMEEAFGKSSSRSPSPQARDWQPIETAPKNEQ
jgi:hypothetical protein